METQDLINALFAALGGTLGWVMSNLKDSLKELQSADKELAKQVTSIQLIVAGEYIKKVDFDRTVDQIFEKLDAILNKLDTKVDKAACEKIHP